MKKVEGRNVIFQSYADEYSKPWRLGFLEICLEAQCYLFGRGVNLFFQSSPYNFSDFFSPLSTSSTILAFNSALNVLLFLDHYTFIIVQ